MNLNSAESIKVKLIDFLQNNDKNLLFANELRFGSLDERVDIATVGASITAYEIKSNSDKVLKFYEQYDSYAKVFDFVYLVTTYSMLKYIRKHKLRRAGLILIDNSGNIEIKVPARLIKKKSKFELACSITFEYLKKRFKNSNQNAYDYRLSLVRSTKINQLEEVYKDFLIHKLNYSNYMFMKDKGTKTHPDDLKTLNIRKETILYTK